MIFLALLAVALLALVLWHMRQLARLRRWLANPVPGEVPESRGAGGVLPSRACPLLGGDESPMSPV